MIVLVSSFLIYVNLCAREDARARVFRTSAAPLQLKPKYQIQSTSWLQIYLKRKWNLVIWKLYHIFQPIYFRKKSFLQKTNIFDVMDSIWNATSKTILPVTVSISKHDWAQLGGKFSSHYCWRIKETVLIKIICLTVFHLRQMEF